MPEITLDFRNIRAHGGDRRHGFEELCTQLASLEERPVGAMFYRKGLGADAGLECYVRSADGAETGWQAKYFFEFGNSQVAQLDKSIRHALDKHRNLRRFIVCLPFNLTDARRNKEKTQLQRWQKWSDLWTKRQRARELKIELWDASAIGVRLQRKLPQYEGRLAYWFDETFLSHSWFTQRFAEAREGLGERYIPETNIELPIRLALLGYCRDTSLFADLQRQSEKLEEAIYDVLGPLGRLEPSEIPEDAARRLEEKGLVLLRLLSAALPDPTFTFPIADYISAATATQEASWKCSNAAWKLKRPNREQRQQLDHTIYKLRALQTLLDQFVEELGTERWTIANTRTLLVYGDAGVGKSHLFGDAAEHQISKEKPALLILGGTLRDDDPWTQIMEQLGLQSTSTAKFLGALDAAGQAAGTRAVIFLDAINERQGIDLWAARLPAYLKSIEPYPHVAIAASCRTTYLPYIVDQNAALNKLTRLKHAGFAGNARAASYYLDKRGIVRMAAPNLLPEFDNPLFLKTCCDFLIKAGTREFPRGLRGVTAIFEFYSEAVASAVEARMKLDRGQRVVARALSEIAAASDDGDRGYVNRDQAQAIVDHILPSHGSFERNLLSQLESEGVLVIEPLRDSAGCRTETVRFTFERYSDHRIAHQLLERHFDNANPTKAFADGEPLRVYVDNNRTYQRSGVIEALATQIPERCGYELQDITPTTTNNDFVLPEALLQSVLWRNQASFTDRTLELLTEAGEARGQNEPLNTLIAIATEPENRFNSDYLHGRLMPLTMAERDRRWSVHVTHEQSDDSSHVETLISWTLQNGQETIEEKRAELAATILAWTFTTTNRRTRDRATKALATLLSVRLSLAVRLLEKFAPCNDDYVRERLLAAAYGAAMQGLTLDGLADLAWATHKLFFENGAPIHLAIRDYASGILELALSRGVLPPEIKIESARPPHESPWPLEDVSEEIIEGFKQDYGSGIFTDAIVSSTVNDGDFARYVLDPTVGCWSALPIAYAGISQEAIFERWRSDTLTSHPDAHPLLNEVVRAAKRMRETYRKFGALAIIVNLKAATTEGPASREEKVHPKVKTVESRLLEAETSLKDCIGEALWARYKLEAQTYLHGSHNGRRGYREWPPRFDVMQARRWVCKRAHDLGWTPEAFGEIERHRESYDRHDHRVERIGKKYQWIALEELLARLADNAMFLRNSWDQPGPFRGAWESGRRNIDPSVLISGTNSDTWRNWDRTWWMPVQVTFRPIEPLARLHWLKSPDDAVNDSSLIAVQDTFKRRWLVLKEVVSWHGWAMRGGDRRLERTTWFRLQSLLVRKEDRATIVKTLSKELVTDDNDIPSLEMPSDAFLGEYPWHPAFADAGTWIEPSSRSTRHGVTVPVQPTVLRYRSEISGYDFSIDDHFELELPSSAIINGLHLQLSNGTKMSYIDASGKIRFFDPSVNEVGPSAALVDREAFTQFLDREGLACVWTIGGLKRVSGGARYDGAFGGEIKFSSIYWLEAGAFASLNKTEEEKPTREQLERFLDEDGHDATLGEALAIVGKPKVWRAPKLPRNLQVSNRRVKDELGGIQKAGRSKADSRKGKTNGKNKGKTAAARSAPVKAKRNTKKKIAPIAGVKARKKADKRGPKDR